MEAGNLGEEREREEERKHKMQTITKTKNFFFSLFSFLQNDFFLRY